jgi:hypothetical protein
MIDVEETCGMDTDLAEINANAEEEAVEYPEGDDSLDKGNNEGFYQRTWAR